MKNTVVFLHQDIFTLWFQASKWWTNVACPSNISACEIYEYFLGKTNTSIFQTLLATRFSFESLSEAERNRSVEAGDPVVLHCEVSNPEAEVCWFRNGEPLSSQDGIEIQTNGNIRMLIIQSADYYNSGTYSCQSADDVAVFQVDITGDRKSTIQICVC